MATATTSCATVPQPIARLARRDRHGDDQARRAAGGEGAAGGLHRGARGEPVVHDDRDAAVDGHAGPAAAIGGQPPIQFGPFPRGGAIDVGRAEAEAAQHVLVDERHAVLRDGADGQLRLIGRAELPHQQHVQRRRQRPRHLGRHRHAAASEAEDDHVGAVGVGGEPRGQRAPGVDAIGEAHVAST